MRLIIHSILPSTMLLLLTACSDCKYPDLTESSAPGWICNPTTDGFEFTAVGHAQKSSAGISFMKQMAIAAARKKLANQINQPSGTNTMTTTALKHSKLLETTISPNGDLYVLVGINRH